MESTLPPKVAFLDPREAAEASGEPILCSVNIPLSELDGRMHELPSQKEVIQLACDSPTAERAIAWLASRDRLAEPALFEYGPAGQGRLWEPNQFLMSKLGEMSPGLALDLGCGSGREAVAMASFGWQVLAVDHLPDALDLGRDLEGRYLPEEHPAIEWLTRDLESELPAFGRRFDLITSFFYLNRPMLARLADYLAPGGMVLLETFTTVHREATGKPRREQLALRPGELLDVPGMRVLSLDEGWHGDRHTGRWHLGGTTT